MRLIALNGFFYPISKWLSPQVETPYHSNWNQRKADRLSRTINTPTMIVGFSDGATAAMRIAVTNENIKAAYIHSPMPYTGPILHAPNVMHFFRTHDDTTPTNEGALQNYLRIHELQKSGLRDIVLETLPFEPFDRPTLIERLVLARRRHIFHNCLGRLPAQFRKV